MLFLGSTPKLLLGNVFDAHHEGPATAGPLVADLRSGAGYTSHRPVRSHICLQASSRFGSSLHHAGFLLML